MFNDAKKQQNSDFLRQPAKPITCNLARVNRAWLVCCWMHARRCGCQSVAANQHLRHPFQQQHIEPHKTWLIEAAFDACDDNQQAVWSSIFFLRVLLFPLWLLLCQSIRSIKEALIVDESVALIKILPEPHTTDVVHRSPYFAFIDKNNLVFLFCFWWKPAISSK